VRARVRACVRVYVFVVPAARGEDNTTLKINVALNLNSVIFAYRPTQMPCASIEEERGGEGGAPPDDDATRVDQREREREREREGGGGGGGEREREKCRAHRPTTMPCTSISSTSPLTIQYNCAETRAHTSHRQQHNTMFCLSLSLCVCVCVCVCVCGVCQCIVVNVKQIPLATI
jgi:hypothetical protein